jgi:alanine-glyoxylate transaminase / serine-glyoxylate transaminase / serine-pyruvate transaminase
LIYVCHGDSSTGTLQPLDGLGALCHRYNCLLLVDAVVSLCCAPINVDQMEIDAIFSGSQKTLSGPPGVSILSLSQRAVEVIKNRKSRVGSFYMDVEWLANAWGIAEKGKYVYHYTPAITLLYGLREALAMVAEEGLDRVISRHIKSSLIVQDELEKMGLKLTVSEHKNRLPGVVAVYIPENVNPEAIREYISENYDISITGGLGPTVGKCWRFGILGENANAGSAKSFCIAFKETLEWAKKCHSNL